jgi:hypothetical protein
LGRKRKGKDLAGSVSLGRRSGGCREKKPEKKKRRAEQEVNMRK